MTTLLLGAVVWFAVAVLLAVGVGRVLARADVDLFGPDDESPYWPADFERMDVTREEWRAHCDRALSDASWSATDEAAYRVTVERAT